MGLCRSGTTKWRRGQGSTRSSLARQRLLRPNKVFNQEVEVIHDLEPIKVSDSGAQKLGIVPQKNVRFLSTNPQTLASVSENSHQSEDLEGLLIDCDLEEKIHANAKTLSGSQKRKLQLAIGLFGRFKRYLVQYLREG